MPLPTYLSLKMTEVVAKQPFSQNDLTSLLDHCASMIRVEQGLVNENTPQCSDWLRNAEQIIEKAGEKDKAVSIYDVLEFQSIRKEFVDDLGTGRVH